MSKNIDITESQAVALSVIPQLVSRIFDKYNLTSYELRSEKILSWIRNIKLLRTNKGNTRKQLQITVHIFGDPRRVWRLVVTVVKSFDQDGRYFYWGFDHAVLYVPQSVRHPTL